VVPAWLWQSYRFTTAPGDQETSARHDFVVMAEAHIDGDRLNLVELKKDQPKLIGTGPEIDCPAIRKDFQKLMLEDALHGKSILRKQSGNVPDG